MAATSASIFDTAAKAAASFFQSGITRVVADDVVPAFGRVVSRASIGRTMVEWLKKIQPGQLESARGTIRASMQLAFPQSGVWADLFRESMVSIVDGVERLQQDGQTPAAADIRAAVEKKLQETLGAKRFCRDAHGVHVEGCPRLIAGHYTKISALGAMQHQLPIAPCCHHEAIDQVRLPPLPPPPAPSAPAKPGGPSLMDLIHELKEGYPAEADELFGWVGELTSEQLRVFMESGFEVDSIQELRGLIACPRPLRFAMLEGLREQAKKRRVLDDAVSGAISAGREVVEWVKADSSPALQDAVKAARAENERAWKPVTLFGWLKGRQ
jgi:hypothetical protein